MKLTNRGTVRRGARRARLVGHLLAGTAVLIVQLWAAAPAHANHSVTVTHQPPPAAVGGSDARLVVAVDGCWVFCNPITLETHYRTGNGRERTITKNLGSFGPQTAVVEIPGRHIAKPAFSYFLEASQDFCWFDACHEADARAPRAGSYSIPVQ